MIYLFRFPIVDGRLPLDPMKISCWKKNIRKDYLTLDFKNILIMWKSCINIIADDLDGFYCVCDISKTLIFFYFKAIQRISKLNKNILQDETVNQIIRCSSRKNNEELTTDSEK